MLQINVSKFVEGTTAHLSGQLHFEVERHPLGDVSITLHSACQLVNTTALVLHANLWNKQDTRFSQVGTMLHAAAAKGCDGSSRREPHCRRWGPHCRPPSCKAFEATQGLMQQLLNCMTATQVIWRHAALSCWFEESWLPSLGCLTAGASARCQGLAACPLPAVLHTLPSASR